ncbi:MAG: hypothetical protein U1E26_12705 [Coriobacteriia bacterium]|nr:hypothetical protein [Coriobacteriia bacterium]
MIERSGDTVSAIVPAGNRKPAAVWGSVLFGGWLATLLPIAALVGLSYAVGSDAADMSLILFGFPVGMLGFAGMGAYMLLWALAGSERVVLTPRSLVLQRRLLGVPIVTREYATEHVARIRYSPTPYMRPWNLWSSILGCSVAFDYGAMTYRFGVGLAESDARNLVEAIGGVAQ